MTDRDVPDALSAGEIKQRSLSGARWLLATRLAGVLASLVLTFFLARAGKEVLGAYALAEIFVGVIITFVVFGGEVVMRHFIPKVTQPSLRGRMLVSYLLIVAVLMAVVLGLFRVFPGWLSFLLRRPFDMRLYVVFIVFAVVEVTAAILAGAVAGLMHIALSAFANLVAYYAALPVVIVLYFFWPEVLREYPLEIILGMFFVGRLLSIGLCIHRLAADPRFTMSAGWHLPRGFMPFCWTTHLATLFTFVYLQCDRLVVLQLGAMAGLGMYQAVIKLQSAIDLVPRMISTAIVPTFSSLLAGDRHESLKKAYALIQNVGAIAIAVVALPTIALSREMLSVFGDGYSDYYYLLALFSLVSVIGSLRLGNTPLLTSLEKNRFRLGVSAAQVSLQLAGTLAFAKPFGVLAIAGFKMLGRLLAQSITIPYVTVGLKMGLRLPRSYKAAVAVAVAATVLRVWVLPEGVVLSILLALGSLVVFVLAAGLRYGDFREMAQLAVAHRRGGGKS